MDIKPQAKRLRRLMKRHSLTQADVVRIVKQSRWTVRNWLLDSMPQDAPEGYVDLVEMVVNGDKQE